MLENNDNTIEALLGKSPNKGKGQSQLTSKSDTIQQNKAQTRPESVSKQSDSKKEKNKKKEKEAQFTTVLKFFNIIIGFAVIAFGVSCYKFYFDDINLDGDVSFVGYILPGYISFSGLIIVLVECNIKFIVRNMKFLYSFIGRGLFNIYVGVMPLSLVRLKTSQDQTFQIIVIVMVSLMCLIGVLYIISKIFCCAKEGEKKKKKNKNKNSESQSGQDSDD